MKRTVKKVFGSVLVFAILLGCMPVMSIGVSAAEGDFLFIDFNKSAKIEEMGMKAVKDPVKSAKYSGRWKITEKPTLSSKDIPTDITKYSDIKFWVYGNAAEPVTFMVKLGSNDPNTDGDDYYSYKVIVKTDGWKEVVIPLRKMSVNRTPLGFNQISGLALFTTGWDLVPNPKGVLYLDSFYLVPGATPLATAAPTPTPGPITSVDDNTVGNKVFYNHTYDEESLTPFAGLNALKKSNIIDIAQEEKGNKYMKLQMAETVTEDCLADMNISGATRFMVVQADFSILDKPSSVTIQYKDSTGSSKTLVTMGTMIKTSNGKEIAQLTEGKWINLALAIDFAKATYDVYVGGKLVQKAVPIKDAKQSDTMKLLRIYLAKYSTAGSGLLVDNYKVYEGKEPRELKPDEVPVVTQTAAPTNTKDFTKVKDAVCLMIDIPYALANLKRVPIDKDNAKLAPFVQGGRTLVPVRFIAESMGATVAFDDATQKITITKGADKVEMVLGSNVIQKNGASMTIDVPAQEVDGRTFVPLRACAESLSKKVFWDEMGFIVISEQENLFNVDTELRLMLNIIREFIYDRPTGEKMLADLNAKNPGNIHPRVLANQSDFDRIIETAKTDKMLAGWIQDLIKSTDTIFNSAPATYKIVENRLLDESRKAKNAIVPLALLYKITGDKKYADRAWKEIESVCSFPDWHPQHYLDTAEMAYGVAVGYDWLYDYLTPEQRAIAEKSLSEKAVATGIQMYTTGIPNSFNWTSSTINWNAVCNAGLTLSSIAVADKYPKETAELFGYVIKSIELGVIDYAPEGGYSEGPGYWSFGTDYLTLFLAGLDVGMGTTYGIFNAPGLNKTGYYPSYMESSEGMWNYHDAASGFVSTFPLFWFANKLNDPDLGALRAQSINRGIQKVNAKDILWYRTENVSPQIKVLPKDKLYSAVDIVTMRSDWNDSAAIFTGLHGGDNSANHGNLDSGNFILDAQDIRWIEEMGNDSYSLPSYFDAAPGGKRWNYYRTRAEGQNTLVINPALGEDQVVKSNSNIIKFETKPKGSFAITDFAPAYGTKVTSAKRGLMLTDNRRAVVVQDEVKLAAPSEVWWFAHTKAKITVAADGRSAILEMNGKRMWAGIVSSMADAKFTVMAAEALPTSPATHPIEITKGAYTKLAINLKNVTDYNMAVVFKALENGQDKPEFNYEFTGLDSWSIQDGDLIVPRLSEITLNGQVIDGFNPAVSEYKVSLPYGTTQAPALDAKADDAYKIDIKQAETLPGITSIKVTDISDPNSYYTYFVSFRAKGEVEISASDFQEGNPPEGSFDGNSDTRWSASGKQWIRYDFANPKEISSVSVAYMSGDKRIAYLEIQVSEDGENFTTVFSGESSGKTTQLEEYKFAPIKAKVVKILVKGNSVNQWNSITEVVMK